MKSSRLHGSETWPVKREHERVLQRAEMRMIRWMCGVRLRDTFFHVALRQRLGIEDSYCGAGLRWCGHVLRKDDEDYNF